MLILLAVQDHKYRIEVGYGLEPILTDGKVGGFGREAVPLLRQNDYNGAVSLMTSRVADVIAQDAGIELTGDRPQFTDRSRGSADHRDCQESSCSFWASFSLIIMFTPLRSVLFWILFSGLGGGGGAVTGAVAAVSEAVAVVSEDSVVAVPEAAAPAVAGRHFVAPAFCSAGVSPAVPRAGLPSAHTVIAGTKFKDRRAGRPSSI